MDSAKIVTLFLMISFLRAVASSRQCENGWEHQNGRCYYFSQFSTNFVAAMKVCKRFGGALVEIDGPNEYQTVVSLATARNFPDFYIGMTDIFSEGNWLQASSYKTQTYFRWSPGEPNNARDQDCAQVYRRNSKMDDVWCSESLYFVCEK